MPTFLFSKLIRDKILSKHKEAGHDIKYRLLSGEELKKKLREKLHEEADEIPVKSEADAEVIEEISDVQQVLNDLKHEYNITDEQVEVIRQAKLAKKGGFTDGVFVESVTLDNNDEWTTYYRAAPDKYPEVKEK
jgi:predicted house-cleaning noncanonical NTP pyrophosphatase (MazG superfamily)